MQFVVVCCDKSQKAYDECVSKCGENFLAVPRENMDAMIKLEDMAEAAALPKVAVFDCNKGMEFFRVMDIKRSILKTDDMAEAVSEVMGELV